MIFQRALRRELVSIAGATFTVLFAIMSTVTLIAILGKAAGGKVASSDVLALIAFAALNYLPDILILTSFISVLLVVTRAYRDSEMVVWFASGQSLLKWIAPVLAFGLPVVLLIGGLSMVATPWAKMKNAEYIERFEKREDLKKVAPGQFKESASTNRIFFVEGASGDSANVQNVFVNTVDAGGNTVVVAKRGVVEEDGKGSSYLVLKNGRRYQGMPGQGDFQTMEFDRYSMRMASQVMTVGAHLGANALTIPVLLAYPSPLTRAELAWRIAAPLTALLLILLAIPLGFVNPRAGSSVNLIIAVLMFFTYRNLTTVVETSIKLGRISFALGWWPLHLAAALLVVLLFAWRLNVNHRYHPLVLWSRLKRRPVRKEHAVP